MDLAGEIDVDYKNCQNEIVEFYKMNKRMIF